MPPRSRRDALADQAARHEGRTTAATTPKATRPTRLRASRPRRADDARRRAATSSSSPRTSRPARSGIPTSRRRRSTRRTWSTYHIAALWIGMSVVITTYTLASGPDAAGHDAGGRRSCTILLGNVDRARADDAQRARRHEVRRVVPGAVPRQLRRPRRQRARRCCARIVACGWFGIQTWIGGLALHTLLTAAWSGWAGAARRAVDRASRLFWLVAGRDHPARARGHQAARGAGRRRCCSAAGVALLGWAIVRGGGLGHILGESARLQQGDAPFWQLFPAALTANVGYWATLSLNIPDFTRYARSQRSQVLGQALGLPTTMTLFAFIGVAVTSATIVIFGEAIWDPVVLIARIGSAPVIIVGALVVLAAQLTTNMAANVVSPANDFSSLAPRRISYVTGGLITAVIGIADDAVEALRRRRRLHLHVADRLLEPDGRDRRHPDRRLLGPAPAVSCRCAICSTSAGATPTRTASTARRWSRSSSPCCR